VIQASVSDRKQCGLRGPVKSVADEYSTTQFDRDGKILEWSGHTSHGRMERKYLYDGGGRLLRISGSNGDWVDEFRYDERGRKTRIRTIPSRAERGRRAYGFGAAFDAVAEGETLDEGGTVETVYDEHDKPIEAKILDNEGTVVFHIAYTYNADSRLSSEKLTTENLALPKEILSQIPAEHREAALEQLKKQFAEISQRTGIGADVERTYVYDEDGHLVERHMRQGSMCEDIALKYNERGDIFESSRTAGGFPHETGPISEPALKSSNAYEYDEHGNWTSRNQASEVGGKRTTRTHVRQLTYYR